ncbi:MAG TPA: winged helix-turn-helix domain-containing protein [Alphaproteobacteria bacterium]|nr:winged helix-turn-helix domain-containing protein [Alphaproteobacteria bacterium]HNS43594.1 winged helix-turn-helix domain-containing protein [Alphaproteobacteria bacterium]
MPTKSTIALDFENPRLKELVREQLERVDGVEIVEEISAATLVLTDRDVVVPVRLGELLDRLRYRFSGRDQWAEKDTVYDLGKFRLEADENRLVHKESGDTVRLTDKERLLLRILVETPDHKLSRETLLKDVWGYKEGVETHTLETHLYRLRQKLEPYNAQDMVRADGSGNYFLDIV